LKFKIDENLAVEAAVLLREAGFEADTVAEEHLSGADDSTVACAVRSGVRVPVTLDRDFGDIRIFPPGEHAGIVILRPKSQDKGTVMALLRRVALALKNRAPVGELWIAEPDRIRFRSG
jgi:predicted nuclease of predicted toxin-antitoxin system